MKAFKTVFIVLSIVVVINLCGCAIGAAGLYESGKAVRDFNAPYDKVFEATKSVFASLNLILKDAVINKDSAKVKGKDNNGKHVNVIITNINGLSSRMEVQVGSIISPDKASAGKILDAIGQQLGL
ncbi:MAG: DUF3568 family protein [Candidatus Omnitrophota bacterium]|nr:DUF3568 family protein [Candidatus Omnitrophota bacterium]